MKCECGNEFPEPKGPWAGKIPCPDCFKKLQDAGLVGYGTMPKEMVDKCQTTQRS